MSNMKYQPANEILLIRMSGQYIDYLKEINGNDRKVPLTHSLLLLLVTMKTF